MGAVYCLAVPGRPRFYIKAAVAAVVALFGLAASTCTPVLAVAVDSALASQSRSSLVRHVRRTENLVLCGRGAACPE
jgi:hypothetical protein